jgi:hypothetical protein
MNFRNYFVKDRVNTPPQIRKNMKRMEEIKEEDKQAEKKKSDIILPKINKRV